MIIKNFTKTLLVANWVLCIIVNFISSSNAADDSSNVIMPFSQSNLIIHSEHRPMLLQLCNLKAQDWESALKGSNYFGINTQLSELLVEQYENYGIFYGKTEQEAQLLAWDKSDKQFDSIIINLIQPYIEKKGITLNAKQIETIKDKLNPGRGTVRTNSTLEMSHMLTLDPNQLFMLYMKQTTSYNISSEWTCYRYTARIAGRLDVGIYNLSGDQ